MLLTCVRYVLCVCVYVLHMVAVIIIIIVVVSLLDVQVDRVSNDDRRILLLSAFLSPYYGYRYVSCHIISYRIMCMCMCMLSMKVNISYVCVCVCVLCLWAVRHCKVFGEKESI